jgi:EmrB/QacA subfamily drug resistance transporter
MQQNNQGEDEVRAGNKWWILVTVGIGTFMSALDASVVNVMIPVLQQYFKCSIATVEWIIVVYLLVVSSLLLAFGRYGDLHGHKIIYMIGFVIFTIGSAACGLAPGVGILIASRAAQALGAGMLFSNGPAILIRSFPSNQRGQALGIQATMTYLGASIGPSLGGWLTQALGWRSVFFINVPIGLIAFIFCLVFVQTDRLKVALPEPFDWRGAGFFAVGLVALLLGLDQGQAWGWTSPAVLGCLVSAILLLAFFLWLEAHTTAPMLDLSLFSNRLFSTSTCSSVINYVCMNFVNFLIPFYLQQGRGFGTAEAGLLLTAQTVMMAIAAPISGSISDKIGSRIPATLGMGVLTFGIFLLSHLGANSSFVQILGSLAVVGTGTGIFISPNNSALLGSAPRERQGIASGIQQTSRNIGTVLGVGLSGAILSSLTARSGENALIPAISTALMIAIAIGLAGVAVSSIRGEEA